MESFLTKLNKSKNTNEIILKKDMPRPGIIQSSLSSPALNQGPSDLQSDALPTELSRQVMNDIFDSYN